MIQCQTQHDYVHFLEENGVVEKPMEGRANKAMQTDEDVLMITASILRPPHGEYASIAYETSVD